MGSMEQTLETKQTSCTINRNKHHMKKTIDEHINHLFRKNFTISNNGCYKLPDPDTVLKCNQWTVKELQMLKDKLNKVKSSLDCYDIIMWQSHTKLTNSAKDVLVRLRYKIYPELLTQAWCKFYEIASRFPLVPVSHINNNNNYFVSVHLCEAPGAFISSLNHWLKSNVPNIHWNWIGMTLNPYYEGNPSPIMIDDDRFIRHSLKHWCFGEDNTGNIMNLKNLDELMKVSKPHRDIFLITADGSIDCTNVPAEQESVLTHLHFCEIVAALHLLTTGGSFLLKIFTIFECTTVCLIYLLSCCFNNVDMVKPVTSKGGNSEIYVVCTDFKGPTFIFPYLKKFREKYEYGPKQAIFSQYDIPPAFIERIIECSQFFTREQCMVIENNIITFGLNNINALGYIKKIQRLVANKWIRDYNLKQLKSGKIMEKNINHVRNIDTNERMLRGSYSERCEKQQLAPLDQLESFCDDLKILLHTPSRLSTTLKLTKLPENLHIQSAKIFHTVSNSKFCCKSALKIKNHVDDILAKMNCKIQFPPSKNVRELENRILDQLQYKMITFSYTDVYDSHAIITKICHALQHLCSGETLVIIGYSLLTHLTFGLLYLIGCAFSSLKITNCDDIGLEITCENFNSNIKVLEFLHEIETASCNAQKQGVAVFEIIPISFLYEEYDLYCAAKGFNDWLIFTYVMYITYKIKENSTSRENNK